VFALKWFGSSGIRGVAFRDFTIDLAMKIGFATGAKYRDIVMGRDARLTGQLFSCAVSSAIMSVGASVCDVGIVTTPTLAYSARDRDCGIMITASHNPPEYNGIKLWNPDGSSFGTEQMEEVERGMERVPSPTKWEDVGGLSHRNDAISDHMSRILSIVGKANLKVVVDCANGPASLITPQLLRDMGCDVTAINDELDGRFPGRPGEPTEENLAALREIVRREEAQLGIAHDGDADRMVAVDDRGRYAGGDVLLKLFARETDASSIVVPVDATMLLDDMFGDDLHRTRVGDVYISEKIKETGADFGGEPSGTWVFPNISLCPDGIFAAARLVEICADRKLSDIIDSIPTLPMMKDTIKFPQEIREQITSNLGTEIRSIAAKKIDMTDGYRIELEDGWGLIRLSGTESKIRIVAEARDDNRAKEILAQLKDVVGRCMK